MTSFLRSDRSQAVALWLFAVAAMVIAMVVVGGATRLTGAGLSITQWQPLMGALPPLSQADWQAKFDLYKHIPQAQQLNAAMTLAGFKAIFWWEWSHRLLGRLIGLVFFAPLVVFVWLREIPRRLIGPCVGIFILGGLQGAVGWWMVASGLEDRLFVAPERLAVHLGLALCLFVLLVWTGLEAGAGQTRQGSIGPWRSWSLVFLCGGGLQCLLGALVAGNHAGLVYNDWPLMNGALIPDHYLGSSLWNTLAHNQGAVQLHHRLGAYLLLAGALLLSVQAARSNHLPAQAKSLGLAIGGVVVVQAALGIATLMMVVPLWLALLHQLGAVAVLTLATVFAWRVRRL
ncbi:MAG: heme synthase [Caulobacteraceae bacterium]|nr:heme synthase [Caulobacteraceae bacterium]